MKLDKNYLKNLARKNRKHNKGFSFFTNTDAGNVELNQAMFNSAMDINGDFVSPDGGNAISESLDADTIGEIQSIADRVPGVDVTVKQDNHGEDDYFIIFDSWGAVNKFVEELGLEDEDELSDLVEWGFSDEWTTCDHCGRAIHTQADGPFWKPDYWADYDYGEIICGDCVRGSEETKRNYLDCLTNEPKRANTILSNADLKSSGYDRLNTEDYANGWYGREDNPKEILKNALDENPNGEFVFSISSQNPFETSFDLWVKRGTQNTEEDEEETDDIYTESKEDDTPDITGYKKIKKNRAYKQYKTYNGREIYRVISSTLEDEHGKDIPIVKMFFGKAPESVVLKGDEAKKYADTWKEMYPDDTEKFKEYSDNQGRYISIHEGSEKE